MNFLKCSIYTDRYNKATILLNKTFISEWPLTVLLSYNSGIQVGFSKNECMKRGGKWGPSSWPDTLLLPAVSHKGSQSQNSSEESQADNESTTALASIRPMATLCAMNKIYTPGVIIRQTIFLGLTLFVRVFPFSLSLFFFTSWITEMPVKHCKLIIVLNIY